MNDTDPKTLSVILPAYNAGVHLFPAVQSVLHQTFTDFELVILDDGSTDGSVEALKKIPDSRLIILSDGQNKGLAFRLNQGIEAAQGSYIARMDADDLCFPTRFECQIDYLKSHPTIDVLATRAVVFGPDNRLIGLLPFQPDHAAITARPWMTLPMPHPTWMARRAWYLKHRYALPEFIRAEDQELLLRSMTRSQFACLDEVLYAYRQGDFNVRKTLRARQSQLVAQLAYALAQRSLKIAALSVLAFVAKVAVDFAAALPGQEKLFFSRMGEPISDEVMAQTRILLDQ
jgi:glycosyltransferase involved in cell wall biosynthesis